MLLFEYDGRQHRVVSVFAFWIIEHFDIVEHFLACFKSGLISFAPDAFALQQIEDALRDGYRRSVASPLVMSVPTPAHAVFEVVLL